MKKKEDIQSESGVRNNIMFIAKKQGCEIEAKQIFEKYDRILKNCKNELEYRQIATMGIAELHKLIGCRGELVVNGIEILPADPNFDPEESGIIT